MEAPDEMTKAFRTRTHGAVKFFARGAREATGTSSSSQGAEESAAAAAVVLDATAKAEAVGAARASGKLGAEVPPPPPRQRTLSGPRSRPTPARHGRRSPHREAWNRLGRIDCSSRCVTVEARRGGREEGARTCVREQRLATEARDASNNGAS